MENLTTQLAELFAAIQGSNVQQIRRLLAANVSPNQCNAEGKTALMVAAQIGNPEIIQMLCAAAASRPRSAQIFFEPGFEPGFETGFETSLHGFNVDSALPWESFAIPWEGFAIASELTISPLLPESLAQEPSPLKPFVFTPFVFTNSLTPSPIASHPADPTFVATVTTVATVAQKERTEPPSIENEPVNSDLDGDLDKLFSGDLNQPPDPQPAPSRDLDQALEAAIGDNDVSTVEALLKSGASFRPANWYDTPVLVTAAAKGYADIVQALILAGANVNSGYDRLPLHMAAEQGHLAVVQRLLNSGACLQDREESGRTALMCAATGGHLPVVQELIARGANANAACRGETALMLAAHNGHQAVYEFLHSYAQA
jgi:ankyrin repeat protein